MKIPFFSAWLGSRDAADAPTPLWRHPEVSFLDWLLQMFFPLILPLKKTVDAVVASGKLDALVALRAKMNQGDCAQHDKLFASWSCTELEVPRSDGGPIKVVIHKPPGPVDGAEVPLLPVVVWLHGGGMTLASARDSSGATFATELLARGRPVVWASVEYRLAPEHPFPAAPHDALAVLEHLASTKRAAALGIDAARLHLAGTSAGGGLAAAVAAAATSRWQPLPVASLLVDEPMLDPACASPSHVRNGATTVAVVSWLRWSWAAYLPDGPPTDKALAWLVSPVAAAGWRVPAAHPPTVVATASADPLRDEGVIYAAAMGAAGKLVAHVEARGSHVLGLALDKPKRKELLDAWATMLG